MDFMANVNLGLNKQDLRDLERLYPDPVTHPDSSYANSTRSTQWERISAMYGDYAYICPVQETAYRVSGSGVPVYKARFNAPDNPGTDAGVGHGSDIPYLSGSPDARYPDIAKMYNAYYASFVATGDPNKYKLRGAPEWSRFVGGNAEHLVVNPNGVKMEKETKGIRAKECAWWRDEQRMKRLNK
jgi:carboxylesterase type B